MKSRGTNVEGTKYILFLAGVEEFTYHGHFVMVFELMKQDLRQALKIYTKNEGFVFSTLGHYALQIGYGLKAL